MTKLGQDIDEVSGRAWLCTLDQIEYPQGFVLRARYPSGKPALEVRLINSNDKPHRNALDELISRPRDEFVPLASLLLMRDDDQAVCCPGVSLHLVTFLQKLVKDLPQGYLFCLCGFDSKSAFITITSPVHWLKYEITTWRESSIGDVRKMAEGEDYFQRQDRLEMEEARKHFHKKPRKGTPKGHTLVRDL